MKIYYITSGYRRPIDMIDNGVIKALVQRNAQVKVFQLNRMLLQELLPDLKEFAPDLVLTVCGPQSYIPVDTVRSIKRLGIPVAVWFVDDPYAIDNSLAVAAEYNYVFTIDSGCIPFYHRKGCQNVFHLPLGTDPDIFYPQHVHPAYHSDICFVGTGYQNRLHFFEEVLAQLEDCTIQLVGHFWEQLRYTGNSQIKIRRKWVNFTETARYYNGAKIVLNIHRSQDDLLIAKNKAGAPGFSINNRTFDITACHSFQLIDFRPDLELFFTPGTEIDFFETTQECVDKINQYLLQEKRRKEMSNQAFQRTLAEHTFQQRIERLLTHL